MKFKLNKIFTAVMCLTLVTMAACKDGKKDDEAAAKMEQQKIDKENTEKEQMAMKADAEAEKMKMDARENSIAGKAMATEDLSTLVSGVKAAGLADMLSEPGEYTVFAPSNQAFANLPKGALENLLKPENKDQLTNVLQYHVVKGEITANQLAKAIKGAGGKYKFKTVTGEELTASMNGDQYVITDSSGKKAQVIKGSIEASNGRVYVIDHVLMAKK